MRYSNRTTIVAAAVIAFCFIATNLVYKFPPRSGSPYATRIKTAHSTNITEEKELRKEQNQTAFPTNTTGEGVLRKDPNQGVMTADASPADGKVAKEEYNIFRDSLVRYMGYANEVGESFRYQFPRFVLPSYGIAFGYCLADAVTSGQKAYASAKREKLPTATADAIVSTVDTLIWQSLASVCIPGFLINQVVKASRFAVAKGPAGMPVAFKTWAPTAFGLLSIPLIIHPIDEAIDALMNNSFRKVQWNSYFSQKPVE